MAQIFPSDIEAARAGGESPEELETLDASRDELDDKSQSEAGVGGAEGLSVA